MILRSSCLRPACPLAACALVCVLSAQLLLPRWHAKVPQVAKHEGAVWPLKAINARNQWPRAPTGVARW